MDFRRTLFVTLGVAVPMMIGAPVGAAAQAPAKQESPAPANGKESAQGARSAAADKGREVFASVDDHTITWQEYMTAFQTAARQKFYHGKPPESEIAALQRDVADKLIVRLLLQDEIKRRNMPADREAVDKAIAGYERQYANSAQWKQNREALLPGLTQKLEEQNRLQRLEEQIKAVPTPSAADVEKYYKAHPELFTEPEKIKISLILLKVDPSSSREVWDKATEEAAGIRKRIKDGADFADMAKLHSGDLKSAENGGDMGYLHKGMLPEALQQVIDSVKPGEMTEPLRLLEGVAIARLDDRKPAVLRPMVDDTAERARSLLIREQSDGAWQAFLARLRANARIKVDESRYLPLEQKTQTN